MKVFLDTIGCKLNQAEIERIGRQFTQAGHILVGELDDADLVVVNTCAVTTRAAADSRQSIRQALQAGVEVIATGCWATLEPEILQKLGKNCRIITNNRKNELVEGILQISSHSLMGQDTPRIRLPGSRYRTRAFIKVQDGCDNYCTFCITRIARGKAVSESIHSVIEEIRRAEDSGTKEVVLCGVNLGAWGKDFQPRKQLSDLVEVILAKTQIPRIRFSSLEPWDVNWDLLSTFQNPRICAHLHLPLQSGCDAILRRMGRKTDTKSFENIVCQARKVIPDLAVTTDIIVGFPGEGEKEFIESLEFVQRMNFASGHVFSFSPRPGTPASAMTGKVPEREVKQRSVILRKILHESGIDFRKNFLGKNMDVLWESSQKNGKDWVLRGHTGNYLQVHTCFHENHWNCIDTVQMEAILDGGMKGKITP